jgi:superfamily II DNA or RNA helicase
MRMGLGGHFGVLSGAFPELENINAPIQIVTLQSLEPYHDWLSDTDLILIDEGHTASFYAQAERAYKEWDWQAIINFTATPFNRGMGKDDRFGDVQRNTALVTAPPYRELERQGYLASLRYHGIDCPITSNKKQDLNSDAAVRWMLKTWVDRCNDLGIPTTHAAGFTSPKKDGRKQAETIQRIGKEFGLSFTIVGEECKQKDYEQAMDALEVGQTNVLCVQALSTGWDLDVLRHVLMFRQVTSRDRAVQIATRVDRPHPSKEFGEIWDFARNFQLVGDKSGLHPKVEDLSESIDASVLAPREKPNGEAPIKTCVNDLCQRPMPASLIQCPICETMQPIKKAVFEDGKGNFVSFIPEATARSSKAGLKAYFRQWRKIGFTQGWNPFAAHKKCAELGFPVSLDDVEFWRGSVGVDRGTYRKYLDKNAAAWRWDEDKKQREMIREFGI